MLIPWPTGALALCIVSAILVSGLAVICWRSRAPISQRYSALLLGTVLLSPHLTVYDLVILAPAFLLVSDSILSQPEDPGTPRLKILLYLTFVLPLIGPLAHWTHVQISVPVMAALLYELWIMGRKSESFAAA
jgi:hypothetical protein